MNYLYLVTNTNKNIGLTFDFVRQIIDNPELAYKIPDKCEIDFIESDFSALAEKALSTKKLIKVSHTFDIISKRKRLKTT